MADLGRPPDGSLGGVDVVVEVKATPTVGDVLRLAERDSNGAYKVLAGRHLWAPVREAAVARGIGYFDARGHLRLWTGPLMVDTAVAVEDQSSGAAPRWRLDSPSALDVALAVLDGTATTGVRATAAVTGRAPGTVSKQLATLRSRHLVDDAGRPGDLCRDGRNRSTLPGELAHRPTGGQQQSLDRERSSPDDEGSLARVVVAKVVFEERR